MTQRLAQIALVYLARTKLEGAEVPTYCEVHNWLTSMTAPQEPAIVAQPQLEAPPNDPPVQG